MKHYEIVLVIHPDQNEQISIMIDKYKKLITDNGGQIHRFEDWGRRRLAYPISKLHKANYILMNIETTPKIIKELENLFHFNDAILRYLILNRKTAVTTASPLAKQSRYADHDDRSASKAENNPRAESQS